MPGANKSILVRWEELWFPSITEFLKFVWLVLARIEIETHPHVRRIYSCQPDYWIKSNGLYIESKTSFYQDNINNLIEFCREENKTMLFIGDMPYHIHYYDDLIDHFLEDNNAGGDNDFHTNSLYSGKKYCGPSFLAVTRDNDARAFNCNLTERQAYEQGMDIDKTLWIYDMVSRFHDLRLWHEEDYWGDRGTEKYYNQRAKTSEKHDVSGDKLASFADSMWQQLGPIEDIGKDDLPF